MLLVQRWQGTKIAELNLPNKTPNACAHRWKRFHAKVLDTTMVDLPEHASSDFVAELSDLMSDHAWWDAVEEKRVELLNDRAGAPPSPPTLNNCKSTPSPTPKTESAPQELLDIFFLCPRFLTILIILDISTWRLSSSHLSRFSSTVRGTEPRLPTTHRRSADHAPAHPLSSAS